MKHIDCVELSGEICSQGLTWDSSFSSKSWHELEDLRIICTQVKGSNFFDNRGNISSYTYRSWFQHSATGYFECDNS